MSRSAIALVVLALVVSGCGKAERSEPRSATQAPSAEALPTPPSDASTTAPDVVGLPLTEAQRQISDSGLTGRVFARVQNACPPFGRVVQQFPKAGRRTGKAGKVRLIVTSRGGFGTCGLDLPRPAPELEGIGREFVAFARGGRTPAARFAPEVTLLVGGRVVRTFSAREATSLDSWKGCGFPNGYAARVCPFSAVRPFQYYPGPIAVTSAAPSHACLAPVTVPPPYDELARVTLEDDEPRSCPGYGAVEVLVDDHHRIAGAHVVLAEP